jgi:hypothetical protein
MPSDDHKPDPLDDVRKGLGLLFRAAKTAVEKLPKEKVEGAVISTAREVGRAVGNVASAIEKQVLKKDRTREDGGEKVDKPAPDSNKDT